MSHTYKIGDRWTVICNSDFSGPIEVLDHMPAEHSYDAGRLAEGIATYVIDIELVEGIVAEIIRQRRIREIESMSDEEIVYWGAKP
jgi:hypothetical protein